MLATAVVVAVAPPWQHTAVPWWQLAALAVALLLGELTAIPVSRADRTVEQVTTSTTFALALLVLGPVSLLLLVHLVTVGVDDLRTRRRPIQMLFNAGQYALSILAARAVFALLTAQPFLGAGVPFSTRLLLPMLVAGLVLVSLNERLARVATWWDVGQSARPVLRGDPLFTLRTSGAQVALAPVAALLAGTSALMLPLLMAPMLALRHGALVAAQREHQALHDPLTGLANRDLFHPRLADALRRDGPGVAVLMLDLDDFKAVNDTFGHHAGDDLLRRTARRLEAAVAPYGSAALAARLGGDEFAVLLVAEHPQHTAAGLAETLLHEIAQPPEATGTAARVRASIGIATNPGRDTAGAEALLQQTDVALYRAKQEGGACFRVFTVQDEAPTLPPAA